MDGKYENTKIILNQTKLLHTVDHDPDADDLSGWYGEDEDVAHWINSTSILILVILYGIVIFTGISGNVSLIVTLLSQPSGRLRNPLLVALCFADLLVTSVSAPLTIIILALTHHKWTLSSVTCKSIYFMQSMPVGASTICLLMLSLDRYATVKHPRLAQLRQRRYLPAILATCAWLSASLICIPILFSYKLLQSYDGGYHHHHHNHHLAHSLNNVNSHDQQRDNRTQGHGDSEDASTVLCRTTDINSNDIQMLLMLLYTLFVFILPALGVILNHLGVRKKLCALSLTARAYHGELPLPMPILRRPTHMIIVTGMANARAAAGVGVGTGGESSDDENNGNLNHNYIESKIRSSPKTPRAMRRMQMQQNRLKKQKKKKKQQQPSSELPLPQTSTLRSRRRLANMLVAAALIFAGCWTPHVVCILCLELGAANICPRTVSEFSLLLGYAHSAVSPLLYWILNHNSLRQSTSCTPCSRLNSAHRFLRSHLRFQAPPPPPSSTNEAALGAFNPRYIKARPPNIYRPPASSHYLY